MKIHVLVIFSVLMLFSLFPNTANAQEWPDWFSQVEKWATENLISDEEFNQAREYLFDKEIFVQDKSHQNDSNKKLQQLDPHEKSQQSDSQGCVEIDNITITSPIELESLQMIIPMGRMWGGHVTPTDHQYWSIVGGMNSDHSLNKSIRVDLFSPADGIVTDIERFKENDYRMVIQHSCSFATLYIHVAELSDKILSDVTFLNSNQHQSQRANVPVKQGEVIGKVTGKFDFSVEDKKVTLTGFISPERYDGEPWKIHTTDPFDYFSSDLQEKLIEKTPRTAYPIGGKIDYDVNGRLVGNWFKLDSSYRTGQENYWIDHLSVAFDHLDPSEITISLGDFNGEPKQFGVKGNAPNPQQISVDNGIVKYELVNYDYFVGNSYWDRSTPYKNLSVKNSNDVLGVVLFEMTDDSKLKVEIFPGKTASQVTGFTDNSEMYDR